MVSPEEISGSTTPSRVVGATPSVPLVRVLDSFRSLRDPKSRVIGGFFYGTPDELTTDSQMEKLVVQHLPSGVDVNEDASQHGMPHAVFSGVASPGSKVSVTIADEVGQPIESRTVYTDAGGNWLAPFGRLSTLDESGLVSVEVLPTTWGGSGSPSFMMFDFPARKILARGAQERTGGRDMFAAVFQGASVVDDDVDTSVADPEESSE